MEEPEAIEKWYDTEWAGNEMYTKYKPKKRAGQNGWRITLYRV